MSSTTSAAKGPRYTVWVAGETRTDSAERILRHIQKNARNDSKVGKVSLEEYAKVLVDDAAFFFPDGIIPEHLATRQYPTKLDQALEYLSAMPSSGVRILSRE